MTLDDAQKQRVIGWIGEGLTLAEIQKRLDSELGVRLTYMEVRFLVDDLKLVPKDVERPPDPALAAKGPASAGPAQNPPSAPAPEGTQGMPENEGPAAPGASKVKVEVDQLARPGALVSGKVTFSDGKTAEWYLDQTGRLGLNPKDKAYKPSAADIQDFQYELQSQLARMGF